MPEPTLKIEPVIGDKDELKSAADKLFNNLKDSLKDSNYKSALNFVTKLETVIAAYTVTIKSCETARDSQSKLANALKNKEYQQCGSLMNDEMSKFKLLHERISAHFGMGHNKVPAVPTDQQIPPAVISQLEDIRKKVGAYKTFGDRLYKSAENVHAKIVELYDTVNAAKASRENLGAVQPIQQPSSPSVPMSSSYGAKQQSSQIQAAKANQPLGAQQQANPNAKK
jgi:hypothetical protein